MFNKVVRREAIGASGNATLRCASRLNAQASDLQPPVSSLQPYPPRSGISLLEVLIAMFVMLFGLMGVAAIFPVGNHYAGKGDQYDRGAVLAGSAFAEVKTRGLLGTKLWIYGDGVTDFISGSTNSFQITTADGPGHAFVFDPIGAGETSVGDNATNYFPYNAEGGQNPAVWSSPSGTTPALFGKLWPVRRVTYPGPSLTGKMSSRFAEIVFRLHDDVTGELPDANDHPGIQRWQTVDTNNTPKNKTDDIPLSRAYTGNYSWLATVVPTNVDALRGMQPRERDYGTFLYEVSVAVFYKRETTPTIESERTIPAEIGPGGDLLLYSQQTNVPDAIAEVDAAVQDIRASQWIAVCGVHPTSGKFLLKWYRLLSLDEDTGQTEYISTGNNVTGRHAMVEGPEWPTDATPANAQYSSNLRAILLPGIIGVSTQTIKLDTE